MQFNKYTHTHTKYIHTYIRTRDENGDEDGNGDGNGDGIGEGGGEAKKRKNCSRDQALLFRTRNLLCRQGAALVGIRKLRSQGLVPVHAHRT